MPSLASLPQPDTAVTARAAAVRHVVSDLRSGHHTWVTSTEETRRALSDLLEEAHRFFAQPADFKRLHRTNGSLSGWREIGVEYSASPDRPDQNETFCYRAADDADEALGRSPLMSAFRAAHALLDRVATDMLESVRTAYPNSMPVTTSQHSWIQLNSSHPAAVDREFIQEAHEDGHLLTLLVADAPGLEVVGRTGWTAVEPSPAVIIGFAGECGALLTGDDLVACPHRVRARSDVPRRISMAYFVNPDLGQDLAPWKATERNHGVDLVRYADENPARFGLPALHNL